MKKMRFLGILLSVVLFNAACRNGGSNSVPPTSGVWRVTSYMDSGKNETSKYSGWTFDFRSNGTFVANIPSPARTVEGTWAETSSSSNKLIISISGTKALDDLSDDWLIVEKSGSVIRLTDDNPSSAEFLDFKKD